MKAMQLRKPGGFENLYASANLDAGKPGRGEILVRIHASSLNFHDYAVVRGIPNTRDGIVPMSDAGGVIVEVGEGVTDHKVGNHVVSAFFPEWEAGEPTAAKTFVLPGDRTEGYAREFAVVPAHHFLTAPIGYSHAEAATLTCAGLTAWRALVVEGGLKAGDTVLVQGTGGVSIFALQIAKMFGAEVIATSSSDAKIERLKALGADHTINYKTTPEWGKAAMALTGGRGVDHVVEIGGAGTLGESIKACRLGGHISMIGVLAGVQGEVSTVALMGKQIKLKGIMVGSRDNLKDFIRAVEVNKMKPIIDKSFALEDLVDAFKYQLSNAHFGKICIEF
jgi:NADPH:quinone reductase-like Zn-dependent oxidoreductase